MVLEPSSHGDGKPREVKSVSGRVGKTSDYGQARVDSTSSKN